MKNAFFFTCSFFAKIAVGILLCFALTSSSCQKDDDGISPQPCFGNDWYIRIQNPVANDNKVPVFALGSQINLEVEFEPKPNNNCPDIEFLVIRLLRIKVNGCPSPEWEEISEGMIFQGPRTITETHVLEETFTPNHPGYHVIEVKALDSAQEIVETKETTILIQEVFSPNTLVRINIGSPLDGDIFNRHAIEGYQFSFDYDDLSNMQAEVIITDQNDNIIQHLNDTDNINNGFSGCGPLNTSTPGTFKIVARAFRVAPIGKVVYGQSVHTFEVW